ncbi:MOSC domain-containing protein [Anatilimnocola sp. NA78]|uniref:MOSC domain-containing protein n=1 Tax=Anatilimnocola sp. NA78 TaxID=3415683 RepID=UPI003CE50F5D
MSPSNPQSFMGQLLAIAITTQAKAPLELRESVEIVAGQGIIGDRYSAGKGAGQRGKIKDEQQVTLIAEEAIAAAVEETGLPISHLITRRNLLVRGVPLNDLVSRTFRVGDVVLRGLQHCDPCGYLEKQTFPHIKQALLKRGGLRTVVLQGGTIRVGDIVQLEESKNLPQ